jgi:hypothetical protein
MALAFDAKRQRSETYGPPSRPAKRILRVWCLERANGVSELDGELEP